MIMKNKKIIKNIKNKKCIIYFCGCLPDHGKAAVTEKNRIVQRTFFLFAWTQQKNFAQLLFAIGSQKL
jgi:hypothetical protein